MPAMTTADPENRTAGRQGSITIADEGSDMVIRQRFAREQLWRLAGGVVGFSLLAGMILLLFVFNPTLRLTQPTFRPVMIVVMPLLVGIAVVFRDAQRRRQVRISGDQLTYTFGRSSEAWSTDRIVAFTISPKQRSMWVGRELTMHLRDGQRVTLFSGNERELAYADQWLEAAVGVVPDALHLSAYPKPPTGSDGELNVVATGIQIAFSPRGIWWPGVATAVVVAPGGVAAMCLQEHEDPSLRQLRTNIGFQLIAAIGSIGFAVIVGVLLDRAWRATRPTSCVQLWGNTLEITEYAFGRGWSTRTITVSEVDHSDVVRRDGRAELSFRLRNGNVITALRGRCLQDVHWVNDCLLTFLNLRAGDEQDPEA